MEQNLMPSLDQHQSNLYTKPTVEDVVTHFNRPVLVNEHGCWLWMGATDNRGYARFAGKLVYPITCRWAGLKCVDADAEHCHTCPNHNCINPDHFYIGTHKQNMEDAAAAGVMGRPRTFSDEQVKTVKQLLADGYSYSQIREIAGVSQAWITKLKKGGLKYAKLS